MSGLAATTEGEEGDESDPMDAAACILEPEVFVRPGMFPLLFPLGASIVVVVGGISFENADACHKQTTITTTHEKDVIIVL